MSNILLNTFGGVTLPEHVYRPTHNLPVQRKTVKVLGGAFDAYRGERAPVQFPHPLVYNGTLVETTQAILAAKIDALQALAGQRLRLWGTPEDGSGIDRWAWAVLVGVGHDGGYQYRTYQPMTLTFELWSPWHGPAHEGAWNLDAGYYFDNGLYFDGSGATTLNTSPKTLMVANDGNYPVDNAGITVTAGSQAITYLKVGIADVCELQFTDTIAAGKALIIDCGARSVLNDGVDAYTSGFQLTANHVIVPWLRLAPGNNSVVVTTTSGAADSTCSITYSDAWV